MDGGAGSSDDELADEQYEESEAGPTSNRGKSSAASSSRARSSAKRRSPTSASAIDSNDQVMMHEGSAGGLSREEAALADRRRRNRETQRAIRKKKAARLQDAEVKVSVFESEIEKLKVNLRELELENMALKREIEDWRMGRIHANPSLVAAASRQSAASSSRLDDERPHPYAARVPYSEHPAYTRAPSAAHYQTYDLPAEERKILGKRRQSFDTHQLPPGPTYSEQLSSANLPTRGPLYGRASPSSAQAHASSHSPSVLQPVCITFRRPLHD